MIDDIKTDTDRSEKANEIKVQVKQIKNEFLMQTNKLNEISCRK